MEKNTMDALHNEYLFYIQEDMQENEKSYETALKIMENSTAKVHGEAADFLYIPKLWDEATFSYLKDIGKTTYDILGKVIEKFETDENYRRLFGFSQELNQWLLLPQQYPCHLPIARVDIFFNEVNQSFVFCEFNADGASAMNRDREIFYALKDTAAFLDMGKKYTLTPFELFDSWVQAFLDIYKSTDHPEEKPFVAIVDFLESGTTEEFRVFQEAFQRQGLETEICEIRDLIHKNQGLYTREGKKIHAVYRRAVTGEMFQKKEEIIDFLEAVKANEVCLIGPLSTQIIHNKIIFAILHKDETASFLTEKEQQFIKDHIPYTALLKDAEIEDVFKNKDRWIIKPMDLYGSRGVYAGIDMTDCQWKKAVEENRNKDYLLQAYCTPYVTSNYDFKAAGKDLQLYNNITGLYLYRGEMKGFLCRGGQQGIISSFHQGRTMTSVLVKSK